MPTPDDAHAVAFARLAGAAEGTLDLGRAALAIGRITEPGLMVEEYAARLDALADRAVVACGAEAEAARVVAAVSEVLFREEGFAGDRTDYYNPQNSFLHDVLERRRGLPILLSVLFMEVAGRAGLVVEGVGAPSHFVVRYRSDE
ncbi:MAG: transglutaminase-like domain-containing protein, partial [Chloroflexi bacterium]|nr:transglutaminase-like domain-containing protein [Chloroflexota bacterium]